MSTAHESPAASESIGPISVVIPAKNSADAINRALNSVVNQTLQPKEVIVVDDGSSDDTAKLAARFPGVSVHRVDFSNRAQARNFGVAQATGEWIAFLDSDDEWSARKLQAQLDFVNRHRLDLAFHDFSLSHQDAPLIQAWAAQCNGSQWYDGQQREFQVCGLRDIVGPADYLFTTTAVIRRSLWNDIGGMRKEYKRCQDIDTWLRAYESGAHIGFLPEVLAIKHAHRQIPGAITYWYKLQLMNAAVARAVAGTRNPDDLNHLEQAYAQQLRSFAGWARRNQQPALSARLYLASVVSGLSSGINRTVSQILQTRKF
jgi:glycosyltransferase involved in cell wall biosynthesis